MSMFEHMIETRRRGVVALTVVALSVLAAVAPAAAVGPPREGCKWTVDVLPLPTNAFDGQVTAGDGHWLAGVIDGVEGARWHDGHLERLGQAFDLDTELNGINASGVAVGRVTGPDHRQHAITYRAGHYEYLPETADNSTALDINTRGETVGYDGATLVVWPKTGRARPLAMPPGATAFGHPALDDDGTVVARTGRLDGATMQWQAYTWTPEGARHPFPAGDVRDIRNGQVVGTSSPTAGAIFGGHVTGATLDGPTAGPAFGDPVVRAALEGSAAEAAFGDHVAGVALDSSTAGAGLDSSVAGVALGSPMAGAALGTAFALGWAVDGGQARLYPGGVTAIAVNRAGLVVGAGPSGEPLLWDGFAPTLLPTPRGYHPGSVTALNDQDAGGFASPDDDSSIVPVRWRCR